MKKSSCEKLLEYIRSDLEVDPKMAYLRGGVILPEVALCCTLRYIVTREMTPRWYSDVHKIHNDQDSTRIPKKSMEGESYSNHKDK
jgi:hypothetical protein